MGGSGAEKCCECAFFAFVRAIFSFSGSRWGVYFWRAVLLVPAIFGHFGDLFSFPFVLGFLSLVFFSFVLFVHLFCLILRAYGGE